MTDATSRRDVGELRFDVDARHIRQLGQQLVGDRVTALVELVKNAYDADATRVSLEFSLTDDPTTSSLIVSDNGSGMSLEDIANGWMRIAGDQKEQQPLSSRFRRTRAGRKGIGRFAAESLGSQLTLWTKQWGASEAVEVTFDWDRDYIAGIELQSVANSYRYLPAENEEAGTRLTIVGLRSLWGDQQRSKVARTLLLLQPPFAVLNPDLTEGDSFRVDLLVNGESEERQSIAAFLQGETAHIDAEVNADGKVVLTVKSNRLDIDRSEVLPAGPYLLLGELRISASYFVFRQDAIGVPVGEARSMGNEFGGVRIYRDGLRLLPYGEPSSDWLAFDEKSRRRTYLNPIGNQNFFAQVLIGRSSNPLLEDTSSREGLLNNEAYGELVEAVAEALITASLWVAESRNRQGKGTDRSRTSRKSREEFVRDAAAQLTDALNSSLPPDLAATAARIVASVLDPQTGDAAAADNVELAALEALQSELELLRVLASLGTSIAVFSHEVRAVLFEISRSLTHIRTTDQVDEPSLDRASDATQALSDLSNYVDVFTGGVRNRVREPQPLTDVLRRFVTTYARPMARGVQVTFEVSSPALRTAPMGETALQAILINLLTNSAKALDHEYLVGKRIHIAASKSSDGKEVVIHFSDTGVGVEEDIRERMFDAFATTSKASEMDLGVGTGLGLKVVNDLVVDYGGSVSLAEADNGFSTTLEVRLPRWRKQVDAQST